jgi:hypothetical protein
VFAHLTRFYGLTPDQLLHMPARLFWAYYRRLPQLRAFEERVQLGVFHAQHPDRVARQLEMAIRGWSPAPVSPETTASLLSAGIQVK